MLQKLVWNILPELRHFKDLEKLGNFLGNYLHAEIEDDENIRERIKNHELKTKHDVVNEYRKIYTGFTARKQKKSLRELARGMFVVAHRDELAKFRELI